MDIVTNEPQEQSISEIPSTLTVNDIDVEFLPLIYEIIRSVDREPHDTQKAGQSSDISQKVLELHKKFECARQQVRKLPGVEYSKEEQLEKLETLRKQLRLKRELVLKYRNMYSFDIPKV